MTDGAAEERVADHTFQKEPTPHVPLQCDLATAPAGGGVGSLPFNLGGPCESFGLLNMAEMTLCQFYTKSLVGLVKPVPASYKPATR